MRTLSLLAGALLAAGALGACDKSPQAADGATQAGDPGTAAATPSGTLADTGADRNADVGGAGQIAEPGGATDAGDATSPKSQ